MMQWTCVSSRIIHPLFPVFELTAQCSLGIKWSTTNAIRIAKTHGHSAPSIKMAIEKTYQAFPHLLSPITRRNHQEGEALYRLPSPKPEPPKSLSHTSASPSIADTLEQSFTPDPEQEWYGMMDSASEFSSPKQSPGHDAEQESHGLMDSVDGFTPPSSPVVPPTQSLVQRLRDLPRSFLKRAGVEFPSYAKHIQWVSGIWTVLPWFEVAENRTNPV
jgi:hypothetical protein